MIIVCQKCSARLQVDEAKVPSRPFTIRCPKCNGSMDAGLSSPAVSQSATSIGGSPSTGNPRFEPPAPAPLFDHPQNGNEADGSTSQIAKLVELLSGLIGKPAAQDHKAKLTRPSWNPRKTLICVPEENRESIARGLAEVGQQVFVAQDTMQAVERMRENQLDVVLLDSRFDTAEQGAVFVTREVNILRPAQRRRLFFVLLSPAFRTMDAHTAFLTNVNAVVNTNEIEILPQLIEHGMREYNELYRDFNCVLGVPSL